MKTNAFTRQKNFCFSLLRKKRKQYFAKLNEKNITDNRKFWQTRNTVSF